MSYYKHHIFFCCNQRDAGADRPSCQEYVKRRIKEEGLAGAGEIRVNKAGCLDRCELGPVAVVYPDETWYTYIDESDLDEIIESHLKNGQPVERLKI